MDACAYAQPSDADASDVIILDADCPRPSFTITSRKAVVLFDDAVDVEGLARSLASVRVDEALLEGADRECARLDRKASKSETECNRDYVKVSQSKTTPPSSICGVWGWRRPSMPMLIRRGSGRLPAGAPFFGGVRTFIKHLKQSSKTCSAKAFIRNSRVDVGRDAGRVSSKVFSGTPSNVRERGRRRALDEVCAFARLVTRVPALVVDGKRLGGRRTRDEPLDELRFTSLSSWRRRVLLRL